jgi:RNase P/RNase MRP subunit p30
MREFIDLAVYPKEGSIQPIIETARQLGYCALGLNASSESTFDLVKRVDLYPRSQNDLGKQVRKHRHITEVIVIHCHTKTISRQAAKDNRIDLLRFPITKGQETMFLDRQLTGLMRDSGVGFEIPVKSLLTYERHQLAKRIGVIRRSLTKALKHNLSVVASSCAQNKYGLRDPYGLASLLSILEIDIDTGLDMISRNPINIIAKNRAKLNSNYVNPGVWIVDE